jgi:hypothetical protein
MRVVDRRQGVRGIMIMKGYGRDQLSLRCNKMSRIFHT